METVIHSGYQDSYTVLMFDTSCFHTPGLCLILLITGSVIIPAIKSFITPIWLVDFKLIFPYRRGYTGTFSLDSDEILLYPKTVFRSL